MRYTLLAAVAAVALGAASAQAALLAYEGFNYTEADGTSLAGLNGGTGFNTAWPTPANSVTLAPGLSFTGSLPSAGKAGRWGASANVGVGRQYNGGGSITPVSGSTTYWYSLLVQPVSVGGSQGTLIPFRSSTSGDGQNGWGVRLNNTGTFVAWTPTQAAGAPSAAITGGTTYLILGRLDLTTTGGTNSIWVYANGATLPTSEAGLGAATSSMSQANTTGMFQLSGRSFSGNSAGLPWDEVRVGTTLGDVIPVPEPATLGLLGLATVALGRRRHHA